MRQVVRDFVRRAEEGDFLAVVDDEGEHTARELLRRAHELAAVLDENATVLAQADNSWRTVAATLAVGLRGCVLALVNRHTTAAEFASAFDDIRPDAVPAEPSALDEWSVAPLVDGTSHAVFDGWVVCTSTAVRDASRWAGGTLIGLTSGATGRAKGVVQTEDALRYACTSTAEINGLREGDAIAAIVPLSSAAAYTFGVYLGLLLRGALVLRGKWEPPAVLDRLARNHVRWTMCVPTMALQLAAAAGGSRPLSGVRSITVGGGPMDAAALARAENALGTRVLRVFGMSECLGHTSPRPDEPAEIRLGCDGRPFADTVVRAVDADGAVLATGEVGRAQVRGPSLFLGYARSGAVEPAEVTPDGFFPTGDLVVVHGNGTITIMGREKDVIIRGGRNIDITEVERAVASCPRVDLACVVPVPDELLGERVAALVVTADDRPMALDELVGHLRSAGLAKTKWPEFVFAVPDVPKTKVGKVSRAAARDMARELHAGME
ncbi:class I adenylate-forming enzyme family protein [Saccharothrix deserti]|uniref:class I adenylate-forming enzyme family protein n=1 Tax=Saccharothrix deserti TaxID=2593674 RepID=UPI00131D1CCF|nr:class I adenylate-forming enzyme family protein [Saccharothrix deserti]